jgi:L-threonylcarbamoyladenylate synthase
MMPDPIGQAALWLASGGLLAYPTETIWGLGADARSAEALERLRRWKRRPAREPVALLVENAEKAAELGFRLGPAARRLAEAFWPGPLTLVVPSRDGFAPGVARADGAVGLRCSAHPLAEALARRLRLAGFGPITATSLNRSGEPPAATLGMVRPLCGTDPDEPRLIDVEGAEAGGDAESTVVDATGTTLQVLRWGALPANEIEPVIEEIERS